MGSALRPVEAIRARTARIGAENLSARVPEPQTRDETAALASTMNAMSTRLQGATDRQRAFVPDAGHELRTPIATSRADLEVAQRLGAGNTMFRDVLAETARLERLVTDLLTPANTDEGRSQVGQAHDVDADDLVTAEVSRPRGRHPGGWWLGFQPGDRPRAGHCRGGTVRFTDDGRLPGASVEVELPGQPPSGSNR